MFISACVCVRYLQHICMYSFFVVPNVALTSIAVAIDAVAVVARASLSNPSALHSALLCAVRTAVDRVVALYHKVRT